MEESIWEVDGPGPFDGTTVWPPDLGAIDREDDDQFV